MNLMIVQEQIEETIEIGRRAGVPVFISHHKILGKSNWGLQKQTLSIIQKAIDEGIQVTCDQYPYPRNMTHLNACVPPWYFNEGVEKMSELFKNSEMREKIKKEMEDPNSKYDNYYLKMQVVGKEFLYLLVLIHQELCKSSSRVSREIKKDPFETFFDIMVENKGIGSAIL